MCDCAKLINDARIILAESHRETEQRIKECRSIKFYEIEVNEIKKLKDLFFAKIFDCNCELAPRIREIIEGLMRAAVLPAVAETPCFDPRLSNIHMYLAALIEDNQTVLITHEVLRSLVPEGIFRAGLDESSENKKIQ